MQKGERKERWPRASRVVSEADLAQLVNGVIVLGVGVGHYPQSVDTVSPYCNSGPAGPAEILAGLSSYHHIL